MRMSLVTVAVALLSSIALAGERKPVLVELFTSEGCSSCPPAEGMLQAYTKSQPFDGVEIIPLAWHVDYFNNPWVDPFSSKDWTARQQQYVDRFNLRSCYTPQMVADGVAEFVGGEKPAFAEAMANAARNPKGTIEISLANGDAQSVNVKVNASSLPQLSSNDKAEAFVVIAENGLINAVRRGENGGSKLRHSAVVRLSKKIGEVDPKSPGSFAGEASLTIDASWKRDQLQVVAFIQELHSGRVLAAGSSPLSSVTK
jgi:hypothetical protein